MSVRLAVIGLTDLTANSKISAAVARIQAKLNSAQPAYALAA